MADNLPPFPPEPPVMPPPPEPGPQPIPWEQPGYPALEALYETAKLLFTKPSEAFARMPVVGDLGRPLLFAVIFGWIGIIAAQIYNIAMRGAMWNFMPGMRGMQGFTLPVIWNVATMVLAPIFVLLGVFIWSAILHLFLMLVGGANSGFTATIRVVCYAGATQIFAVVPFCGGFIATVWAIVLEIIGLAAAHRTTQGKAALAVLLPIVLCCVCLAIVAAAFGAAIFGVLGRLR